MTTSSRAEAVPSPPSLRTVMLVLGPQLRWASSLSSPSLAHRVSSVKLQAQTILRPTAHSVWQALQPESLETSRYELPGMQLCATNVAHAAWTASVAGMSRLV